MSRPFSAESVFRALAHHTRRRILETLYKREHFASELLDGANLRKPTLSEHLRVLRQSDLVSCRRRGRRLVYQLNITALREVSGWLSMFEKRLANKSTRS